MKRSASEMVADQVPPDKPARTTADEDDDEELSEVDEALVEEVENELTPQRTVIKKELLVQPPLKVNARDKTHGRTALHKAAAKGDVERVQQLLDQGADPSIRDNARVSPLHEAATRGRLDVVKLLLTTQAIDVSPRDIQGDYPLLDAAQNDFYDICRVLLDAGADPTLRNDDGCSALSEAEEGPLKELLRRYSSAEESATRTAVVQTDASPRRLHAGANGHGVANGRAIRVDARGARQVDEHGRDALHRHVLEEEEDLVEQYLEIQDADFADNLGDTPLHAAARLGNARIVSMLLARRARQEPNILGNFPLHEAKTPIVVQMLLERGSALVTNKEGKTPSQLALPGSREFVLLEEAATRELLHPRKRRSRGGTGTGRRPRSDSAATTDTAIDGESVLHRESSFMSDVSPVKSSNTVSTPPPGSAGDHLPTKKKVNVRGASRRIAPDPPSPPATEITEATVQVAAAGDSPRSEKELEAVASSTTLVPPASVPRDHSRSPSKRDVALTAHANGTSHSPIHKQPAESPGPRTLSPTAADLTLPDFRPPQSFGDSSVRGSPLRDRANAVTPQRLPPASTPSSPSYAEVLEELQRSRRERDALKQALDAQSSTIAALTAATAKARADTTKQIDRQAALIEQLTSELRATAGAMAATQQTFLGQLAGQVNAVFAGGAQAAAAARERERELEIHLQHQQQQQQQFQQPPPPPLHQQQQGAPYYGTPAGYYRPPGSYAEPQPPTAAPAGGFPNRTTASGYRGGAGANASAAIAAAPSKVSSSTTPALSKAASTSSASPVLSSRPPPSSSASLAITTNNNNTTNSPTPTSTPPPGPITSHLRSTANPLPANATSTRMGRAFYDPIR
ncbi:hypothetical protein PYCC9005_002831 [Savitreella phatthalungensis]